MIRKLLVGAVVVAGVTCPALMKAEQINLQLGDQPYYTHGDRYDEGDCEKVWSPGHWTYGNRYVHGRYLRGERWHDNGRHEGEWRRIEHKDKKHGYKRKHHHSDRD